MSVSSPIGPVLDQLADLALWEAELQADPIRVESSLVSRLARVPDRRRLRGRRHPLPVVPVLTACATPVVGNDSVAAIRQWAARTSQEVLESLGARRDPLLGRSVVPGERTFRRVPADLDADALEVATCGYAADVVRGIAPVPVIARTPGPAECEERRAVRDTARNPAPAGLLPGVAVDGKALRGARTADGRVFPVGAIAHRGGVVLGQRRVPDKRGENTVVKELLTPLDLAGMVVALDALHTTKKTARLITQTLHAHYLLILKGNQPPARQAARLLLTGTDAEFVEATDVDDDRGHGRVERRTLRTAPADATLLPGARQVFRLRRDSGDLDGVWTGKEIVFGVTSLPADLAGPEHLNFHERAHRCVENRLHWVRDVTFHEDSSQLRTGTAPRPLAGFRNLAINTFRLDGRANIAHARRDLLNHNDAFAVYGI
ncbi:putative transposase YbfD/YdcC [Streptosporangium album]|uniref:Putative transposase YbfD/YdcC n=1 Tax=Streptosporangium album TaxID=47479 RepID=A0A7W7WD99_9ACTN|nr:ISAs1 family transposase [Streptosporangium album]MBB4942901.1 putative transposase YbfD/YdcC [Streptosporangium album]